MIEPSSTESVSDALADDLWWSLWCHHHGWPQHEENQ